MSGNPEHCKEFPPFPLCSGNGVCLNGICICNKGWSSLGDFAIERGVDCNIHILTIQIMWIITGVLSLTLISVGLRCIYQQYCLFIQKKAYATGIDSSRSSNLQLAGHGMKTYLSDPVRVFPIGFVIVGIIGFLAGILHSVWPEERLIGGDALATTMASLATVAQIFGAINFSQIMFKFLSGYIHSMPDDARMRTERQLKVISRVVPLMKTIAVAISVSLMCSLGYPDKVLMFASIFHFLFLSWCIIYTITNTVWGFNPIIRELGKHLSQMNDAMKQTSEPMRDLYKKMKTARFMFLSFLPGLLGGWFLFGILPSFSRNSGYFFPFLLSNGFVVDIAAIVTVMNNSKSNSASNQRKKSTHYSPLRSDLKVAVAQPNIDEDKQANAIVNNSLKDHLFKAQSSQTSTKE